MRRVLIAPGVVLLLLAALVQVASPASATTASGIQVVFQHAGSSTDNTAIAKRLEALFAATGSKWSVYLSMFSLKDGGGRSDDVVDHLLDTIKNAHAQLHVVVDAKNAPFGGNRPAISPTCGNLRKGPDPAGSWTRAATRLWCIATEDNTKPGRFFRCKGSCLGAAGASNGIDHNKFVLFAGPNGERIVASASANWTPIQLGNKYQTMTVTSGRSAVFRVWKRYWDALRSGRSNPTYGDTHTYNGTDIGVRFFPRGTDPRIVDLSRVDCAKHAHISADTNLYTDNPLTQELRRLQTRGCVVKVVLQKGSSTAAVAQIHRHRCIANMHAKDLIIDAVDKTSGDALKVVWTGSRPFIGGFRDSDDADVRLHGSGFVSQFQENFDPIFAAAGSC